MRPRLSIKVALGLVAVVAFELTALRNRTEPWSAFAVSLTLGVLTFALLGSCFGRGKRRAFWTGFAFVGTVYLLAAFLLPRPQAFLVTTTLVDEMEAAIHPPEPEWALWKRDSIIVRGPHESVDAHLVDMRKRWAAGERNMVDPIELEVGPTGNEVATAEEHAYFARTGHALLVLVLATLGGLGALYFVSSRSDRPDGAAPASEPAA